MDDGGLERMAGEPPAQQRGQRQHQHHWHEDGADLVYQPLDRSLGGLGVLHQADDVGQHGVHPHGSDLQHHAAVAVDGATGQFVARILAHGQRLAGEHGFVHLGVALFQGAVHGKAFAGLDDDAVTHQHVGHGYVHLAVAPQPMRHVRTQSVQGANGGRGLAFGAGLQPLAQQHQGDDHR